MVQKKSKSDKHIHRQGRCISYPAATAVAAANANLFVVMVAWSSGWASSPGVHLGLWVHFLILCGMLCCQIKLVQV